MPDLSRARTWRSSTGGRAANTNGCRHWPLIWFNAGGRQLLVLRAGSPQAIDSAFTTLVEQRAGALLVGGDPFLVGRSQQLVAMAARHTIPAIYDFRESVLLGGLMSYGSNLPNNYRQLEVYAGRILKGESAADLPIMHPALFDFTINLVAAKALGLDVPPMLLARADEVIE